MRKRTWKQDERERRLAYFSLREAQSVTKETLQRRKRMRPERGKVYGAYVVASPTHLRFHGGPTVRKKFEKFLGEISEALEAGRVVRLDFSKTERLFPCGMLLLMGALDSWLEVYPPVKLTATYPQNDLVEQMLQSAGVLQRLSLSHRKAITHDDVTRWHQFEGHNVDASIIAPFMERVSEATGKEWQLGLGDCVAEALTNVKKHAYEGSGPAHWWMFATVNHDKRQVFVAMHDRGATIPGTLLAKPDWIDTLSLRRLRRGGDCELISAAVGGRTRTKLYYRGKGLPEMLEFTARHTQNALAIYSRNGYFMANNAGTTQLKGALAQPVDGTLVIWTLNFGEKA